MHIWGRLGKGGWGVDVIGLGTSGKCSLYKSASPLYPSYSLHQTNKYINQHFHTFGHQFLFTVNMRTLRMPVGSSGRHVCGCYIFNADTRERTYLPQVKLDAHTTVLSTASRTVVKQTFINTSTTESINEIRCALLYPYVYLKSFTTS